MSDQLQKLQNDMAAMQKHYETEQVKMDKQMSQMHQENEKLRAASKATLPTPPTAPRIDIRVMSPQPFYGTSGSNAHQWLMEVERYFTAVNLGADHAQCVLYASTFLKDTASIWFGTMSKESGSPSTWDEFKSRFLSRFQPIAAAKVARAQLRLLKQKYRVAGYSQEFLRVVQLIPDMHLTDQLESYMVGLSPDLALEVERKEPQTLLEAMEFAQRIELMSSGRRHVYGRLPGMHHFSRSSASQGHNDPMEISAIHQVDDANDFFYGTEHPPSQAETALAEVVEQVQALKLNGMFQRGGGGGGSRGRGGHRGGHGGSRSSNSSQGPLGLSKEEFAQLMREGKCFKCKGTGHQARHCTVAPQSKN